MSLFNINSIRIWGLCAVKQQEKIGNPLCHVIQIIISWHASNGFCIKKSFGLKRLWIISPFPKVWAIGLACHQATVLTIHAYHDFCCAGPFTAIIAPELCSCLEKSHNHNNEAVMMKENNAAPIFRVNFLLFTADWLLLFLFLEPVIWKVRAVASLLMQGINSYSIAS